VILIQVAGSWETIVDTAPLKPFDDRVLEFFNDLSKELTKAREHSDVVTFGFWCRKASLLKEKAKYDDSKLRLGRGVAFHSTPSNVPVNFAFSFAAGLLSGNANIVRLPGKDFEQVNIITDVVKKLVAGKHKDLSQYICFVKYPPDKALHDLFSSICDVRIVWGGDGTINELRQSPLKPRATDITFADRYSIAIINADRYNEADDKINIAQDFYNDTYFSDQNACTSPRIVFWYGNEKEAAKETFWTSLHNLVKEKYELAPVQSVGKLAAFYKTAANMTVSLEKTEDNYITRVKVDSLNGKLMDYKYNSGFFFENDIVHLKDILPICGERLQTLTYYGFSAEEVTKFMVDYRPKGIDRAVPMGKSMDFSLVWDGRDLIIELSREVTL